MNLRERAAFCICFVLILTVAATAQLEIRAANQPQLQAKIARVQMEAQLQPAVLQVAQRIPGGIYVPTPKGDGDTLDSGSSGDSSPTSTLDVLRFGAANQITGTLLQITPDGLICMKNSDVKSDVQVLLASARKLTLAKKAQPEKGAGRDRLRLSNGDTLTGSVQSITPDTVLFQEPALGSITVARRVVRSISFGGGAMGLIETVFAQGGTEAWKAVQGTWAVNNGLYFCGGQGACFAAADAAQDGPVTLEFEFECTGGYPQGGVAIMASSNTDYWGRDSIVLQIQGNCLQCFVVQQGRQNHVGYYNHPQNLPKGQIRASYDPDKQNIVVWLNDAKVGEWATPGGPKTGKYVLLTAQQPIGYRYLKLVKGLAAPTKDEADDKQDRLLFQNKDRVSGDILSMDQGKIQVKTAYGAMQVDVANTNEITFTKEKREVPRRRARDIEVQFNDSRLTFELGQLTEAGLLGKAEFAGDISIRRDAIKSIRFNLYD